MIPRLAAALFFAAAPALAQSDFPQWELGASIGYGIYRSASIISPGGDATAGIRNRFSAGAVVCEDLYEHISGEIRYTYQDGHPFLSTGAISKDIQGESHTFTYDLLFHVKPRDARIRPYFAAGAGAKYYEISGPAPVPQPIPSIATLNQTGEWKFVVSLGPGVKLRLTDHILLRADFRDYLTRFPKRQISPAANGTARGIYQQFTPMFGVSYVF